MATLVWLVVYALVAMGVGVRLLPQASGIAVFTYYLLAGTLWTIPVGLLLPWMHRESSANKRQKRGLS